MCQTSQIRDKLTNLRFVNFRMPDPRPRLYRSHPPPVSCYRKLLTRNCHQKESYPLNTVHNILIRNVRVKRIRKKTGVAGRIILKCILMLCVFIPFPWSLVYLNLMFVVVLVKQETLSLRNFACFFFVQMFALLLSSHSLQYPTSQSVFHVFLRASVNWLGIPGYPIVTYVKGRW